MASEDPILRIMAPVSVQDDDLSNFNGGSIDPTKKVLTTGLSARTTIGLASSEAADINQVYLVEGLSPEHRIVSEQVQLTGTIEVRTSQEFVKLYRVRKLSGSALAGTVTIAGDVELGVLDPTSGSIIETIEMRAALAKASTHRSKPKVFHEKFFIRNDGNQTVAVTISEFHDPNGIGTFALDPDADSDTQSVNRTSRTPNIPANDFDGRSKTIMGLAPGESWGVWIQVQASGATLWSSERYTLQISSGSEARLLELVVPNASSMIVPTTMNKRYGFPLGGGLPHQFVELAGGRMVEEVYYEPDPTTYRGEYYYNSRLNRLYKKLKTADRPVWKIWR